MKLLDVIKMQTSGCKKCLSVTYSLPCVVDKSIVSYFKSFGSPIYNINVVKLLKINSDDGFKIESKIGLKSIKLIIPKKFKSQNIHQISRKIEFEQCLCFWLSRILNIKIVS